MSEMHVVFVHRRVLMVSAFARLEPFSVAPESIKCFGIRGNFLIEESRSCSDSDKRAFGEVSAIGERQGFHCKAVKDSCSWSV